MRYLITGGLGFIGHNLIVSLSRDGNTIRVLDNLTANCVGTDFCAEQGVDLVVGDVMHPEICRRSVSGVDVIIHLAAQTGVPSSLDDPLHDLSANATGTLNMLEAARGAGISRFVLASSNAVFGEQIPPLHEEMLPCPKSPYGVSKLAAEGYCRVYHQNFGIRTVALRFANIYGPGSHGKVSAVAKMIKDVLEGRPLTIHGDGAQTRDFVYVGDIVQALRLASESNLGGEVFAIATGVETSVGDLAVQIARLAEHDSRWGRPVEWEYLPSRAGDVQRNYSSIQKSRRMLGFHPRTSLEDGLQETWDWFLETFPDARKKVA